jgi:hypothetical protein
MIHYVCDKCGKRLDAREDHRFIVNIEVFAAESSMELTKEDLDRDHRAEMQKLIDQLARANPDDIEDQTYRRFRFDLCTTCHRRYLADPIART